MTHTILYSEINTFTQPHTKDWIPVDLTLKEINLVFISYQGDRYDEIGLMCDTSSSKVFHDLAIGCYKFGDEKQGWLKKIEEIPEYCGAGSVLLMPYSEDLIAGEIELLMKRKKERVKKFLYSKKDIDYQVKTSTLFDDFLENEKFTFPSFNKIIVDFGSIWIYCRNAWGNYFIVISKNADREKTKLLAICQVNGIGFKETNSPDEFPVN